jgi:hypothetical protein
VQERWAVAAVRRSLSGNEVHTDRHSVIAVGAGRRRDRGDGTPRVPLGGCECSLWLKQIRYRRIKKRDETKGMDQPE